MSERLRSLKWCSTCKSDKPHNAFPRGRATCRRCRKRGRKHVEIDPYRAQPPPPVRWRTWANP